MARGGDVGRRGDAQRGHHGRPSAGRDELPQLRRPDTARGLLAAQGGRPWPRGCLSGARTPGHRGNVSLYNESPAGAIAPTPEIGVVGLVDDVATLVGPAFVAEGDAVILVGATAPGLIGSAYAALAGAASEDRPPTLDLEREAALQAFVREAIGRRLVASAQDVSGGGLAVALAEASIWSGLGADLRLGVPGSPAAELFGEGPSRIVVTCRPRHRPALELLARQHGLPVEPLGLVGGPRLVIDLAGEGATGAAEGRGSRVADAIDVPVADLAHAWHHGLARALGQGG